jgi:nitronate monooxygenase
MALETRLTQRLRLDVPIISAPMAFAAGGRLAAAVSAAGGFGLIGGGYGDETWLREQFAIVPRGSVGCGFITWSLKKQPHLLDLALDNEPRAICLSFGDPEPFAARIKDAGALLLCQVQTRRDAERAIACGADVVIAQGSEAGGHGQSRATLTLVPEVADLIAAKSPETLLCAAGGIADGRGLAAALMLGADGVLVGSRLWASVEANVGPRMHAAALSANGDDTVRSQLMDLARRLDWPSRYTARVLRNKFIERWQGREAELMAVAEVEAEKYRTAWVNDDPEGSNTFVGEAVGMIDAISPVSEIIRDLVAGAEARLSAAANLLQGRSRIPA